MPPGPPRASAVSDAPPPDGEPTPRTSTPPSVPKADEPTTPSTPQGPAQKRSPRLASPTYVPKDHHLPGEDQPPTKPRSPIKNKQATPPEHNRPKISNIQVRLALAEKEAQDRANKEQQQQQDQAARDAKEQAEAEEAEAARVAELAATRKAEQDTRHSDALEKHERTYDHAFVTSLPPPPLGTILVNHRQRSRRASDARPDVLVIHVLSKSMEEGLAFYVGVRPPTPRSNPNHLFGCAPTLLSPIHILAHALFAVLLHAPPSDLRIRTNNPAFRCTMLGQASQFTQHLDNTIFRRIRERVAMMSPDGGITALMFPPSREVRGIGNAVDAEAFAHLAHAQTLNERATTSELATAETPNTSLLPHRVAGNLRLSTITRGDTLTPHASTRTNGTAPAPLFPPNLAFIIDDALYHFDNVNTTNEGTHFCLRPARPGAPSINRNVYEFRKLVRDHVAKIDSAGIDENLDPAWLHLAHILNDDEGTRVPRVCDLIYTYKDRLRVPHLVAATNYTLESLQHGSHELALIDIVNSSRCAAHLAATGRVNEYDDVSAPGNWYMPCHFADHSDQDATNSETAVKTFECAFCQEDVPNNDRRHHAEQHFHNKQCSREIALTSLGMSACHTCSKVFLNQRVPRNHHLHCKSRPLQCPAPDCEHLFQRSLPSLLLEHLHRDHLSLNDEAELLACGFEKCDQPCCASAEHEILKYQLPDHARERNLDRAAAPPPTTYLNNPKFAPSLSKFDAFHSKALSEDPADRYHTAGTTAAVPLRTLKLAIRQPLLELASALCSEVTAATRAGRPVDRSWHFIIMNIDMIILAKDPEHRTYSRRDMDARVKDRIARFKAGEIYELFAEYYDAKLSHRNTQQEVDPETEKQRKTQKVDRQVRQGDLSGAKATLVSTEKRLDMASSQLRDMFDAKLALPRPYNDHPSGLPPEEDPSSQPLPSSASRRTSTPGHFDDELDEGLTEDLRSRREKTTGATEKLIRCLRRTKWDKAPGVFGDSMNFWKTLGTFKSPDSDTETYAAELTDYLLLFAEGLVDDSIAPFYTLAVPAAFDKNPPGSAEVKLRPIGIPGALRRIVGKFVMALNLPIIAKYLTGLGQFAIGTLNGCGYICQYVALAFETMIDRDATNPEEWLSEAEIDELPEQIREDVKSMDPLDATKAYSSADLTSMFNVINRDELLRILDSAEAREALLPFKNYILLCYPNGQKSVYCGKHSEGFWWAAQIFGFIQGDPIASACASIVEAYVRGHLVGTHVRKQLAHLRENPPVAPDLASTSIPFEAKAAYLSHRRQHRVEQTTLSSLAYMDDSSWINSYQVHVWAARRYNLLAPHYGLFENQQKAAYLLGKVDTHWREYDLNSRSFIMGRTFPQLLERDFHATQEALNAQGIKLLGNAIGSEIGRKPILDMIVTSTMQKVKLLEEYSIPFDSSFAITKFCFGGSINYILPSARNDREAQALAYRAYEIMTTAVTYLTHTPSTDPAFKDSFAEMCLPHEFGGSGLSDPRNTYKASLVAARLLVLSSGTRRLEDSGIRLSACDVIHGAPLARDQHKFLRTLLPPSHDPDDISALIPSVRLAATLLRAIGDKTPFLDRIRHGDKSKLQHELDVMRGKAQFARIMNDSRTSNPPRFNRLLSISQKCSGATLAQLDQTRKRGDYSREDFKFRYHLPIFDFAGPPTACPLCDKNGVFDRFGEHVFRCDRLVKSQRTRLLHNPLRNVTALGLARLSRVADSMITRDSVRTEPLNLLATKPNVQNPTTKRPADVLFHLPAPLPLNMVDAQRNPVFVNQIALDIKTVHSSTDRPILESRGDFSPDDPPQPLDVAHLLSKERDANNGAVAYGGELAKHLASTGVGYAALTVDVYGAIGPTHAFFLSGSTFPSTSAASDKHYHRQSMQASLNAYRDADFSYDATRDGGPAPPYFPRGARGLLPALTGAAGTSGLPWYQSSITNRWEQEFDTERSQGVGASLLSVKSLFNEATSGSTGTAMRHDATLPPLRPSSKPPFDERARARAHATWRNATPRLPTPLDTRTVADSDADDDDSDASPPPPPIAAPRPRAHAAKAPPSRTRAQGPTLRPPPTGRGAPASPQRTRNRTVI